MNELEIKTERLAKMLAAEKLGGVLLNSQHNFAWLTGGGNNGVDLSRENGVGSILVRADGKRFLIANQVEMPRLTAEEVSAADFELLDFPWEKDKINANFVLENAQTLLAEGSTLATDIFFHPQSRVIEGSIAKCRYQLTAAEIERFKRLGKDAGQVIGGIFDKIEPGQAEKEIAARVRFELGKRGINPVVTLVAADERLEQFRHPLPSDKVWKRTLMIVVCAKRDGLIASLSRIFAVGTVSDELKTRTAAVARVHARMMHATRTGESAKEIFAAAKDAYSEVGFPGEELKHHQGGAAGYKTRDWVAHSNSTEQVFAAQAFAWNPSITGTKSEETFIVTENDVEIMTKSPGFPAISTLIDGIEYLTPDILVI
jgi:Xaa-Pro dipeptidase